MPHQIEVHDMVMDCEIGTSEPTETDTPAIRDLDRAFRSWKVRTDMDTLEFSETAPLVFSYEVKHNDLREASGTWDFNADINDPGITIDAPDPWGIDELIRPDMRDAIIRAVREVGLVSIEVTFF